jgi:hypothetical protein
MTLSPISAPKPLNKLFSYQVVIPTSEAPRNPSFG